MGEGREGGQAIPAWQSLKHRQDHLRLFLGKDALFYHYIVRYFVGSQPTLQFPGLLVPYSA